MEYLTEALKDNKILIKSLSTKELETIGFLKKIGYDIKNKKASGAYVPWYDYREAIVSEMTEEHFKTIYSSKNVIKFLELCFGNSHVVESILIECYNKFPHLVKDILKNSVKASLNIHLIHHGFHRGIEDINALAKSQDVEGRLYAASRCSLDVLKELRNDKDKKVRLTAYKRLGVDEYLDEMLEDKNLEIRYIAVQVAPMYYPKFKDMAEELSKKVFTEVAKKIDVKHIPYILGNRNLNTNNSSSKYIKNILDKRLSLGNIDFADEE